jgi:A/G-specific adenine glycosylase
LAAISGWVSRLIIPIPSASALLVWYDRHRRALPWRALPGETPDPYLVWLSEIMLQQTNVTTAIPYYQKFVRRFPDVNALAAAPLEAVLVAWAGLGYYARARNLHACARAVAAMGGFPRDAAGLVTLPGIGPYTATAIAAIAFGQPGVPVDGNVERVTSRIFSISEPMPSAKPALRDAAALLGAQPAAIARPSDFAQALFDLGATLCTPTQPACALCPWMEPCAGRREGIAAELPRKAAKTLRPMRFGAHFWLTDAEGNVLLRRRKPVGLLGGMTELPGTEWLSAPLPSGSMLAQAPMAAAWREAGEVRHVFTHFELRLTVFAASVVEIDAKGFLLPAADLPNAALPSVMRKCVRMAMTTVPG